MSSKIKVRLLNESKPVSSVVSKWIKLHNIKFDKRGYADAPVISKSKRMYHVPNDPAVRVYQTLDNREYYSCGRRPKLVKRRLICFPVLRLERSETYATITRCSYNRNDRTVQQSEEVVFNGSIKTATVQFTALMKTHYQLKSKVLVTHIPESSPPKLRNDRSFLRHLISTVRLWISTSRI